MNILLFIQIEDVIIAGLTESSGLMMQGLPDPCQGNGVRQAIPFVKDSLGGKKTRCFMGAYGPV